MGSRGLTFAPATAARWPDVETVFGKRGACAGCWCMFWRLPRREWEAGSGAGNRRAFRRLVRAGREPGVLAYRDGKPIGWCAVAPRGEYSYFERTRILKPVDDRPVWSVTCFFVLPGQRRRGVSLALLKEAVAFARERGARIVEGYPVEPRGGDAPAAFLWHGTRSTFDRAGFREVARGSARRPIMRRFVRAARSTAARRSR